MWPVLPLSDVTVSLSHAAAATDPQPPKERGGKKENHQLISGGRKYCWPIVKKLTKIF